MSDFAPAAEVASTHDALTRLKANMRQTIKGKDEVIDQTLVCLLAGGHLLIEDLPGVGKTTLAYSLARSMDCAFSRIQFTSDLLPTDVTGVSIYDETLKEFVFKSGPVFANVVLADEINRASTVDLRFNSEMKSRYLEDDEIDLIVAALRRVPLADVRPALEPFAEWAKVFKLLKRARKRHPRPAPPSSMTICMSALTSFSSTSTSTPALRSSAASHSPTGPAPTTITSTTRTSRTADPIAVGLVRDTCDAG